MSSTSTVTQIWVNKKQLKNTQIHQFTIEHDSLLQSQILLETESFGFSANNITYGAFGERMGYWGFFPADDIYGILPIWGFAKVIVSKHPDIKVGDKVYGYLPFATHLVVTADKVTEHGFYDVSTTRKSISRVYDNYLLCDKDPGYNPEKEPWQLNYRPLFMTSFVLEDYIRERMTDDLQTIIVTSASSKTAYGTAHLLKANKQSRFNNYQVIGLTSKANLNFVESLECFDTVASYDDLYQLNAIGNFSVLDFAAKGDLLNALTSLPNTQIKDMILIGATDWQAEEKPDFHSLDAEIFFAPNQVKKRMTDWGQAGFMMRYARAWNSFMQTIDTNINVVETHGFESLISLYLSTLEGEVDPNSMNVCKF